MAFTPRSKRGTPAETDWQTLRAGVPEGLAKPLYMWVQELMWSQPTMYASTQPRIDWLNALGIDLHVEFPGDAMTAWQDMGERMLKNQEFFIDVVDWCLHHTQQGESAYKVEAMLVSGSSVWKVERAGDVFELQQRIDSTVEAAARTAATPGSAAAHHLALAWSHIYSKSRNPKAGYDEAVMAVECVVSPVVIPKDPAATLGKAIAAMVAAPTKWTSPLGEEGVETAVSMMRGLWRQQKRHGVADQAIVVNQAEAEAAVHLATTLVHWFSSGAIKLAQ